MTTKRLLLITVAIASFAACGDDSEPADTTAQIANPASEFCVDQGGTLELVDEAGGQVGYCNLPDGRRIEEWEFYNSENG